MNRKESDFVRKYYIDIAQVDPCNEETKIRI